MKQLLDFPRAQRLRAYRAAGDDLLLGHEQYSCLALDVRLRRSTGALCDVGPQFWGQLFDDANDGPTVNTRDQRWPRYRALIHDTFVDRAETNALYWTITADALQTRLMMLAWAHAVDQAGDLESILS